MGPELVGLKANEWTYKRGIYAAINGHKVPAIHAPPGSSPSRSTVCVKPNRGSAACSRASVAKLHPGSAQCVLAPGKCARNCSGGYAVMWRDTAGYAHSMCGADVGIVHCRGTSTIGGTFTTYHGARISLNCGPMTHPRSSTTQPRHPDLGTLKGCVSLARCELVWCRPHRNTAC
jgi:hypothetical protein